MGLIAIKNGLTSRMVWWRSTSAFSRTIAFLLIYNMPLSYISFSHWHPSGISHLLLQARILCSVSSFVCLLGTR